MTVASEITRLQNAKSSIRNSIQNKWVSVPADAKLDLYAQYIDQIQAWEDEVMAYLGWVLSINWGMIYVNSRDRAYDRYSDFTNIDWNYLYMIKPYELSDYSSSWASVISTKCYCMALAKWWTSTINADLNLHDWGWYTSTSMHYYYMWGNVFRFYWATWEYTDSYRCAEVTFSNGSWTTRSIGWDWNPPAETWWDLNLLHTEVEWSMGDAFYFKWKPN